MGAETSAHDAKLTGEHSGDKTQQSPDHWTESTRDKNHDKSPQSKPHPKLEDKTLQSQAHVEKLTEDSNQDRTLQSQAHGEKFARDNNQDKTQQSQAHGEKFARDNNQDKTQQSHVHGTKLMRDNNQDKALPSQAHGEKFARDKNQDKTQQSHVHGEKLMREDNQDKALRSHAHGEKLMREDNQDKALPSHAHGEKLMREDNQDKALPSHAHGEKLMREDNQEKALPSCSKGKDQTTPAIGTYYPNGKGRDQTQHISNVQEHDITLQDETLVNKPSSENSIPGTGCSISSSLLNVQEISKTIQDEPLKTKPSSENSISGAFDTSRQLLYVQEIDDTIQDKPLEINPNKMSSITNSNPTPESNIKAENTSVLLNPNEVSSTNNMKQTPETCIKAANDLEVLNPNEVSSINNSKPTPEINIKAENMLVEHNLTEAPTIQSNKSLDLSKGLTDVTEVFPSKPIEGNGGTTKGLSHDITIDAKIGQRVDEARSNDDQDNQNRLNTYLESCIEKAKEMAVGTKTNHSQSMVNEANAQAGKTKDEIVQSLDRHVEKQNTDDDGSLKEANKGNKSVAPCMDNVMDRAREIQQEVSEAGLKEADAHSDEVISLTEGSAGHMIDEQFVDSAMARAREIHLEVSEASSNVWENKPSLTEGREEQFMDVVMDRARETQQEPDPEAGSKEACAYNDEIIRFLDACMEKDGKLDDGDTSMDNFEGVTVKMCIPCNKEGIEVEAAGYCDDCADYLCGYCVQVHLLPDSQKEHKLTYTKEMAETGPESCEGVEPGPICNPCFGKESEVKAVGYCEDCAHRLCESCFLVHLRPDASSHHKLVFTQGTEETGFESSFVGVEKGVMCDPCYEKGREVEAASYSLDCAHNLCGSCFQVNLLQKSQRDHKLTNTKGKEDNGPESNFVGVKDCVICDSCYEEGRDVEADNYCLECAHHLCGSCFQGNLFQKSEQDHKLKNTKGTAEKEPESLEARILARNCKECIQAGTLTKTACFCQDCGDNKCVSCLKEYIHPISQLNDLLIYAEGTSAVKGMMCGPCYKKGKEVKADSYLCGSCFQVHILKKNKRDHTKSTVEVDTKESAEKQSESLEPRISSMETAEKQPENHEPRISSMLCEECIQAATLSKAACFCQDCCDYLCVNCLKEHLRPISQKNHILKYEEGTSEVEGVMCGLCYDKGREVEAASFCLHCNVDLCGSCFQVHLLQKSQQDHRLIYIRETVEVEGMICDPCKDEGSEYDAVGYCKDCMDYLCDVCLGVHLRPKSWRNHTLIYPKGTAEKGRERAVGGKSNPEMSGEITKSEMPKEVNAKHGKEKVKQEDEERCVKHPEKIIEYFCEGDMVLGCSVCMTLKHRLCKITYLPSDGNQLLEMANHHQLQEDVLALKNEMKEVKCMVHNSTQQATDISDKAISDIKAFRNKFVSEIDKVQRAMVAEVGQMRRKDNKSIDKTFKEFKTVEHSLNSISDEFAKRTKDGCPSKQMFLLIHQSRHRFKECQKLFKEINANNPGITAYQFQPYVAFLGMKLGSFAVRTIDTLPKTAKSAEKPNPSQVAKPAEGPNPSQVKPAEKTNPSQVAKPAERPNPSQVKPAEKTNPSQVAKPAEGPNPSQVKPAEKTNPSQVAKPAEGSNPSQVKPAEKTNPSQVAKPAEGPNPSQVKPAEKTNPSQVAKPAERPNQPKVTKPSEKTNPPKEVKVKIAEKTNSSTKPKSAEKMNEPTKAKPANKKKPAKKKPTSGSNSAPMQTKVPTSKQSNSAAMQTKAYTSTQSKPEESSTTALKVTSVTPVESVYAQYITEINVKDGTDQAKSGITDMTMIENQKLAATDFLNSCVKIIDTLDLHKPLRKVKLTSSPYGVAFTGNRLAITQPLIGAITLMDTKEFKSLDRLPVGTECSGIVYRDEKFFISFDTSPAMVKVMTVTGSVLRVITQVGGDSFQHPCHLALHPTLKTLFVSDWQVMTLGFDGGLVRRHRDLGFKELKGISVSIDGNLYVCDKGRDAVYVLVPMSAAKQVFLDTSHGIKKPLSVLVTGNTRKKLYVSMEFSDAIKLFQISKK